MALACLVLATPTVQPAPADGGRGGNSSGGLGGVDSPTGAGGLGFNDASNGGGGIPLAFGALTPAGLTQVSGETIAGTQQPGFSAATQFVGTMSDPTVAGRADAQGPLGYAEEGDAMNVYASTGRKRSGTERDAYAMITKAPPRAYAGRWNVWASGFGGAPRPPTATPRPAQTHRAAGSAASRSAPTTGCRRRPWPALPWPAARRISASRVAAAGAPTCSRSAASCGIASLRPTSPRVRPMAGSR